MPAVELNRLKTEIAALVWLFTRPEDFIRNLRNLFERYGNKVYRPGHTMPPRRLDNVYNIPPLVLKQLELELEAPCRENPAAAFLLLDVLREEFYLESRLLAAALLGKIPVWQEDEIINRLRRWAQPTDELQLLDTVLDMGCATLRKERPDRWIGLVNEWILSEKVDYQMVGIHAIIPAIRDPYFLNLPPIFLMVTPLIKLAPAPLQASLQDLLVAMSARTPVETGYFLKQILLTEPTPNTARLIRRSLPGFPSQMQESLRSAMKMIPDSNA